MGLVAQAGFAAFLPGSAPPRPSRGSAASSAPHPRELIRSVTLQQTLELVRAVVDVVEEQAWRRRRRRRRHRAGRSRRSLREAVLRYSREVAFAAAEVYARAAEARGAWDARLEALVVDALVRGEADDDLRPRAAALGWQPDVPAPVVVGPAGGRRRTPSWPSCAARPAGRGRRRPRRGAGRPARRACSPAARATCRPPRQRWPRGSGPGRSSWDRVVAGLAAAARSARAALAGVVAAARAWPEAPRPVLADDLLPERVLAGDAAARRALVDRVYVPLAAAAPALLETLTAYLGHGRSLEATAAVAVRAPQHRPLPPAHGWPRSAGWDPSAPRERFVLQVALAVGGRWPSVRRAGPSTSRAPSRPRLTCCLTGFGGTSKGAPRGSRS